MSKKKKKKTHNAKKRKQSMKTPTKTTTSKNTGMEEKHTSEESLEEDAEVEMLENKQEQDIQVESIPVEKEQEKEEVPTVKKSHKTLLIVLLALFIMVFLCLLFSTVFGFLVSKTSTIIPNVFIQNIDVSGLTKEQALEKVSPILEEKLAQPITLKYKDYETTVFPQQFDVSFSLEDCVDMAYKKGRTGNIFQNNYEVLLSFFVGNHINSGFSYAESTMDSLITEIQMNLSDRFVESSYYIDNNTIILSKGKDGVVINQSKLKKDIAYAINNLTCSINSITIPMEYKTPSPLDIKKIYQEVYRAPQDAYYTTDPYVVYPHVDGVDFAISLEEAEQLLLQAGEECQIPLKVLSPSVTVSQIGIEAFPNLLGSYSTNFSTSNVNRSTNIRLATSKINGTVVMPGEVFSYNQTVGQRTSAAGFKSAAVYSNGEVTTGIGGGICQVSSTLYNSVLLSNLEIVERYNHGFDTGYVPAGRDATVSWGGPDFKFKNVRDYPIKIVASVSGGKILIEIYGLRSENDYEVEIQSYITQYIKYKTIEQKDPTLPKGQTKVIQNGSNGCKSVAYRILKKNGEVISKTLLSQDTYNPHNKIIAVGTKK